MLVSKGVFYSGKDNGGLSHNVSPNVVVSQFFRRSENPRKEISQRFGFKFLHIIEGNVHGADFEALAT
jgi:hypothetical protein